MSTQPAARRSHHDARSVVITGIGAITPIGNSVDAFWNGLLSKQSGIGTIQSFDAASFPSRIAGEVRDFVSEAYLSEKQRRAFARSAQLGLAAFHEAAKDAAIPAFDPYRTDVLIGSGAMSFEFVDEQVFHNPTAGKRYVEGSFDPYGMGKYNVNTAAAAISQVAGTRGFVSTLSTACTSGLSAIGVAFDRIRDGHADIVITGATDSAVNHFTLHLFCAAGFLSTLNEEPDQALCPFDSRRTRSVLAEGACILILEDLQHALARGAKIYGELVAFHQEYENVDEVFRTDRSGGAWALVIQRALQQAQSDVEYICAHGTSDQLLDAVESKALHLALGPDLAQSAYTSSIKSAIGSPFAAAGALQVATAALALKSQTLPPTRNFRSPDPDCRLRVSAEVQNMVKVKNCLVNSHAHGGVNASLVLREVS